MCNSVTVIEIKMLQDYKNVKTPQHYILADAHITGKWMDGLMLEDQYKTVLKTHH